MFIRAYLRASTQEQDANRARQELIDFAAEHGKKIASFYVENESGAKLKRPELMKLIADASEGDIILVEGIDRLGRLIEKEWETLKKIIAEKGLLIVSKELPTSWIALDDTDKPQDFMRSMLKAINGMLIDMLAAVARKDYEDRRKRQDQGIAKAQREGRMVGKQPDLERHETIKKLLKAGDSYSAVMKSMKCSRATVAAVAKKMREEQTPA